MGDRAKELYDTIISLAKEAENSRNELIRNYKDKITKEYKLNSHILYRIIRYSKEDITTGELSNIKAFLKDYDTDNCYDTADEEVIREVLLSIFNMAVSVEDANQRLKKLQEDIKEGVKEYLDLNASKNIREERLSQLEKFKKDNENETDEKIKKENERKIKILESSLSFSFLKERIESLGESEIIAIKDQFFNDNRSNYVVRRFNEKIKKYGFKNNILSHLLSIEEKFLDEEYHPFNNIFLFTFMRFVSHSDPYSQEDSMNIKSLTNAVASMIYHNYDSDPNGEEYIKSFIMSIDDLFKSYTEEFKEKNITYELNPTMLKLKEETNNKRKETLLDNLSQLGINTLPLENKDYAEVKEFYNKTIDEILKKNINPEIKVDVIEEESDLIKHEISELNKEISSENTNE